MSCYRRPNVTAARVFLTIHLARPGGDTLTQHIDALRWAVAATRQDHPFGIIAWVVLPDHMHCIWSMPTGDKAYGMRVGAIKARFSKAIGGGHPRPSHTARRERGVWQRRFWEHHIRDRADLNQHIAYCWQDPVRHDLVAHPSQWPFSSWHRDHETLAVPPRLIEINAGERP